jgi:predicted aldo/keto reductase-like oxidoreductase
MAFRRSGVRAPYPPLAKALGSNAGVSTMSDANRRDFLKATAGVAIGGIGLSAFAAEEAGPTGLPRRPLGKTGEQVSIIGLGGYHIGTVAERQAVSLIHEAIDEGITFFDNAWDYHQGGSEELVGKALAAGQRRDKVFLMTKNCARDYQGSQRHLEDSLRRLRTDRIDLWQFHEINYDVDPDWIFERGALKAALEAKKAGKIRYIGFTGHKDIKHHLKMLAKPFDWDTAQMPINILDAHYRSFQKRVVPVCNRRGIGVIGMKALACGHIPRQLGHSAEVCRRYALSLPISTLVCGIASRENLRQDLAIARHFKPMSEAEKGELLARTKAAGSDGRHERFKTATDFDGGYHRRQHGV